jgi:NAD(P)-dependent dehydrogenase (short-subunit alcohol dehydrogenase family)
VTVPEDCADAVARTIERFGRLDTVVASAGLGMWARFDELADTSVLRRLMDVNYLGVANVFLPALPHVVARRGMLVAISSVQGVVGVPGRSGYAASKHALQGLCDSLRIELRGSGVDVLTVMAHWVRGTEPPGPGARPDGAPRDRRAAPRRQRGRPRHADARRAAGRPRRRGACSCPVGSAPAAARRGRAGVADRIVAGRMAAGGAGLGQVEGVRRRLEEAEVRIGVGRPDALDVAVRGVGADDEVVGLGRLRRVGSRRPVEQGELERHGPALEGELPGAVAVEVEGLRELRGQDHGVESGFVRARAGAVGDLEPTLGGSEHERAAFHRGVPDRGVEVADEGAVRADAGAVELEDEARVGPQFEHRREARRHREGAARRQVAVVATGGAGLLPDADEVGMEGGRRRLGGRGRRRARSGGCRRRTPHRAVRRWPAHRAPAAAGPRMAR